MQELISHVFVTCSGQWAMPGQCLATLEAALDGLQVGDCCHCAPGSCKIPPNRLTLWHAAVLADRPAVVRAAAAAAAGQQQRSEVSRALPNPCLPCIPCALPP